MCFLNPSLQARFSQNLQKEQHTNHQEIHSHSATFPSPASAGPISIHKTTLQYQHSQERRLELQRSELMTDANVWLEAAQQTLYLKYSSLI